MEQNLPEASFTNLEQVSKLDNLLELEHIWMAAIFIFFSIDICRNL